VYLLSSALQKAIRRNDLAVARRAGFQLLAVDPARLWRRIMTVGLEDIGIGDTTVATELVSLATLKAGRRVVGGDRAALEAVLVRACAAIKDRTGDHLASVLHREPIDAADAAALNRASQNALAAIIASSQLPWTRRVRAAALLSGRNSGRYSTARTSTLSGVFADLGVSDMLIAACSAYASRSRDPLSVLVPMAWLLSVPGRTKKTSVTVRSLPEPEIIGEWPAYALDPLHTRSGRRAVDLWVRSYLTRQPFSSSQVAAALWNGESAACDRTLAWPLANEIRQRAHRADLLFRGVPPDHLDELGLWIVNNWPALTCARRAALSSAIRGSVKLAEASEQANLPLPVPERPQRRG